MIMLFVTIGIALSMIGGYFYSVLRIKDRDSEEREFEREDDAREQPVSPRA